jgi:D-alanyl-D-alanine carboxypeptidase
MNAHGLHHPQHFTTAHDLALIARAAMQQPYFRRVVSTLKHPWVTDLRCANCGITTGC